jgi:hypothetical protein
MTCSQQFLIASGGPRITLNASYSPTSTIVGAGASAQFRLSNIGDIEETVTNNTIVDVGDWILPKAGFSNYDCMLTLNSGTNPTAGTMATWLNLGTSRTWQLTRGTLGLLSNNCTLQVRNATSLVVLATSTIVMTAEFN